MPATYKERKEKAKKMLPPGISDVAVKAISREERMKRMIDEQTGYSSPATQPTPKPKKK